MTNKKDIHRRGFLKLAGTAGAGAVVEPAIGASAKWRAVHFIIAPNDPLPISPSVLRTVGELQVALSAAGFSVESTGRIEDTGSDALRIIMSNFGTPLAAAALKRARIAVPDAPESLVLLETTLEGRPAILACGSDARGVTYALLELADRVRHGDTALKIAKPIVERPANPVRSVMRQFVSEIYDKPWFYDRAMWSRYFGMLAAQRFNRFHLAFGLAYDALKNVADSYFLFPYPFLLSVPGYDVRVTNVSDAERDKNLDALRFIGKQAVACGIDFQLGIWVHGYQWQDSPKAQNIVTGLTPETHAAYCGDAMTALLKALPAVSSVGLRIHGESGVAEGSYDFWKAVFDGVARCGRKVEIDMHAKGIDAQMIDTALATGMPVNVAPKFSAEHMGLPYHPAEIRPSEIPVAGAIGRGLMAISEGQRSFTRYGYADLLRDDRKYTVRHRLFSGTQRILMWGDAVSASAYARAFQFCGSTGADLMEPLTCRGRRGTAVADIRRSGYRPARIEPQYDWQKHIDWYRALGRTMYNPDTDPAVFLREARGDAKAEAFLAALASASRILPLLTSAHSESAACDLYWPEIYWNLPIASPGPDAFWDTPSPKTFQNVTALDPQLFSSCSEFAGELLGERSGKYSPVEVAQWLEGLAARTEKSILRAGAPKSIELQRLKIDAEILARLGLFFADKLRSGVLYAIHEKTKDRTALESAVGLYQKARSQWAALADPARSVYAAELSVSDRFTERGQWSDRLAGIDADITALQAKLATATNNSDPRASAAFAHVIRNPARESLSCGHSSPMEFTPRQDLALHIAVPRTPTSARLWYRHVNQAERWASVEMSAQNGIYGASIPAAYTDSPYPLQYYFELKDAPDKAWLYPGFNADLTNQPYFVLQRTSSQ
jgi:hypothetical protein